MRMYVGNKFICLFELMCIYILQVRAYFIVSWNSSSFFSKKETKPQINFYTNSSVFIDTFVSNKVIARRNIWSIETQSWKTYVFGLTVNKL